MSEFFNRNQMTVAIGALILALFMVAAIIGGCIGLPPVTVLPPPTVTPTNVTFTPPSVTPTEPPTHIPTVTASPFVSTVIPTDTPTPSLTPFPTFTSSPTATVTDMPTNSPSVTPINTIAPGRDGKPTTLPATGAMTFTDRLLLLALFGYVVLCAGAVVWKWADASKDEFPW